MSVERWCDVCSTRRSRGTPDRESDVLTCEPLRPGSGFAAMDHGASLKRFASPYHRSNRQTFNTMVQGFLAWHVVVRLSCEASSMSGRLMMVTGHICDVSLSADFRSSLPPYLHLNIDARLQHVTAPPFEPRHRHNADCIAILQIFDPSFDL